MPQHKARIYWYKDIAAPAHRFVCLPTHSPTPTGRPALLGALARCPILHDFSSSHPRMPTCVLRNVTSSGGPRRSGNGLASSSAFVGASS